MYGIVILDICVRAFLPNVWNNNFERTELQMSISICRGKQIRDLVFAVCVCFFACCGVLTAKAAGTHTVEVPVGATAKEIQTYLDMNAEGTYDELIVSFPAGKFLLDRTLYVYSDTTIKAEKTTIFEKQKIYGAILEGKLLADNGGYDSVTNITVDGGVWDSTPVLSVQDEGTETMRFIHASGIKIKNAEFSNVPVGSHLIVFAGVADSSIENCVFHGYGDGSLTEVEPKEAVQLDIPHNIEMVPTLQGDVVRWNDLPCKNITITGCEFYDFSRAIGSHLAIQGVYHEGIVISNNTIRDMDETAIKLFNYKDTTISNNRISGGMEAILVYTRLQDAKEEDCLQPLSGVVAPEPENHNIVITGNEITDIVGTDEVYGDAIRISAVKEFPMNGVTVSNNKITNVSRYAVFASWTKALNVTENEITTSGNHAVLAEQSCRDAVVKTNTISKTGKSGIALYYGSDNAVVSENKISDAGEYGVYLLNVSATTVSSNQISTSARAGIYTTETCKKTAVKKNTITNAGEEAIWLRQAPESYALENIIKSDNQYAAIRISESNKAKAKSNTITTAGDGIYVYEAVSVEVSKNKINAGQTAINVNTNSQKASILENTISSAGEFGIRLYTGSSSSKIYKNVIKQYAVNKDAKEAYAIGLYQSGGTSKEPTKVNENKISGTGKQTERHAIRLSSSDYVTVDKNTVSKADGYGITLLNSNFVTISRNQISDAVRAGIYTTGNCKKTAVKKNTVKNSGEEAIWLRQAPESYASENVITSENTAAAIRISESNKAKAKSNTITTAGDGIYVYEAVSVEVSKNKINAGQTAINVNTNSQKASILENTISSAGEFGIRLYTGSSSSKIYKNVIKQYAVNKDAKEAYAIGLYQSGGTSKEPTKVNENKISGTGKQTERHAIRLSSSDYVTVDKNTVSKADGYGITLLNSNFVTISRNQISDAVRAGIYTTGNCKKTEVKKNTINNSGEEAVWIRQAPESAALENEITVAGDFAGIRVSESNGTNVSANTIVGGLSGKQVWIYSSEGCMNRNNVCK